MTLSERHHTQLIAVLTNGTTEAAAADVNPTATRSFLESLGAERVRVRRTDWQGHGVLNLLWHFDNLKPGVRRTLTRYLLDRWHRRDAHEAADASALQRGTDGGMDEPSSPAPLAHAVCEPQSRSSANTIETDHGEASLPLDRVSPRQVDAHYAVVYRRDWFDRFTDWVAAILSLLEIQGRNSCQRNR